MIGKTPTENYISKKYTDNFFKIGDDYLFFS